jgi:hypothetical protein
MYEIEICYIELLKCLLFQIIYLFIFPYCGILLIMDALLNDLYYCVFNLSRYVDLTILDPKVCYLWFEFYV